MLPVYCTCVKKKIGFFFHSRRRTGQIPKEILELTKTVKSKLNTGQHAPVSRPNSAMSVSIQIKL